MIPQCHLCIHRPRQQNGLGDCVLFMPRRLPDGKKGNERRETFDEGFGHHVELMSGRHCGAFKPGDRRTSRPVPKLADLGMEQVSLL